jgi:hypothetical protein
MLSWLFGLVLGIFLVAGLSQTAFAQDPPGSTCENPLVVDPVGTPLVNFAINSEAYGNNYTSAMITPASSYLNGNDIVFQFTLTETSFINASIAGVYTGLIFVGTCPNLATPAPRLAFAGSATGAVVPQFSLVAGTYFMIASTWPAPQFTDMVINLSATIIQEQPNLVVNPSTLDVGMAVPGLDVVSKKVTLANQGLSDAVVSQSGIVFSGANADDFSVTFPETTVKSLNPITTVMDKTIAGGALPAIIDNAGNNRGAGFNGTHVFVASRQNGNHVYYWDVNNPSADPLELNLTGVTGGTFALSDLNVVGNHIFVSNMVFVGGVFKVYHWNGVAAQPTVLLEFTSDARLGDAFTVIGDPATSALLVASGHATKNFYAWEIVNGAIPNTTPTIYTINEIEINASFGRLTKVPNENMFIASGSGMGVLLLDNQMNVLAQVPKAWFPWWAMYSQVFHSSGQRYLAYSHVKSPPNENMLYVLDISEGATVAEALQILAASTFADKVVHTLNLGTIGNGNASVGFDLVDDMFMAYSAGNGFAVQHFTNVDPLVIPFGTSKTLTVHFDPAVPGSSSADMTINYNSTNSPANVSLTGTGYLPYTAFSQNFDEVAPIPAGWMPGGWSGIVQSTVPLAVVDVRNIGAPTSLPNHVRLFNSTDVNSVLTLVSPAAVNLTNSWVRFSSKMSSTAHTGNVQVGYLTNRNDPSTFVMVGTVPVTGTYAQYSVSFLGSGLTFPETAYIGFRFVHTLASRTLYIDDIFYEAVPTLPVFTANKTEVAFGTNVFINETAANTLQISNTGAGTLTINQADVTITGADAAAFSIVYPGTQTWPIALTFGQTFTFQLRFAPTEARAYVASLNIQDNIGGKAVNAIPLLGSGYDATIQPGFLFDFAGTTFPPQDWRRFKGLFGTEPVLPTTEAIWVHKRFANNPDLPAFNSANINLYGTSRRHWLMSPPINLGDGSVDYQLEFDLALTFWNQTTPVTLAPEQKFAVVISTDGGLTWSMDNVLQWWNETTPISNTGDHIVIDLSAYSGRVMLGFYGEMTVSTAGTIDYDLFVRNVAVNLPPADPLLFAENFDYPLGSLLTDNGYTAHSGAGTNPIDVTNGLDFAGYIGSGIGGAANLDNTGEDVHQSFEPQTTGNVYAAFVVKTEPTNAAGYFFHFGIEPWATTYFTRVWVNATGDGIGIGTTVDAYAPITAGEPTLVVAKFNMETKVSSLYVFNTFPTEEPATPFATFTETSTAIVNVGGLGLRQYNAAQKVIVDGIRVATTWEDAVMAGEITPPELPSPQNLIATATDANAHLSWEAPALGKSLATAPWQVEPVIGGQVGEAEFSSDQGQGVMPTGIRYNVGSKGPSSLLFDNGPFVNNPGAGPDGSDLSQLHSGMTTFGPNISHGASIRVADDFTVTDNWNVESFTFYAYQTSAAHPTPPVSSITGVYLKIWNGMPDAEGSQVVYGDMTVNALTSSAWTNAYRVSATTVNNQRPIMSMVCATPGLVLQPGTYYVEWSATGSIASGPWGVPVTINDQTTTGNSIQFTTTTNVWTPLLMGGTNTGYGLSFLVEGTTGGGGGLNLTGYNIYRDGTLLDSTPATTTSYTDGPLSAGTYSYGVTAVYGAPEPGESAPVTASVTIELPSAPSITVAPESLSETLVLGTSSAHVVTVSNTGSSALEFELTVSTGSTKSAEAISYVANFELPTGGDRSNPQVSPVVATKEVLSSGASMRSSFSEGFDDITTLPAAGWALINNSAPVGTTSWFQASATAPFPAHSGTATSYIGANFNNTAGTGTISNWLLTPETALANGHTMSFWTRVPAASSWPDRLEVRLSTNGASQDIGTTATSVGDFTTILLSVNPDLTVGGYPDVWTQYTVTISGLAAPTTGRIAFRYFVTGGGPSGNNSNYIGIDSFEYTGGGVTPPDSWLTATPLMGTVAAGETMEITVGFNAADLTVGSYQGSLVFTSNDPVTPTLTVPVSLTVTNPIVSDFPAPRNLTVVDAILAAQLSWQAPDLGGGTTEDFFEDFEAGTLPTGWVTYDVDNDGYGWDNSALEFAVFDAHTGLYCMTSASYRNDVGALTPNNWLVTPPIAVTATSELSFWVDAQDPAWSQEQYYVKVSTTGNAVADFTNTVHSAISPATWTEVVVDLSSFAGQTIYIAFQHANVTDMFFIKIDDVTVSNTVTKAAFTAPVAAGPAEGIYFRTSGMSQSEIDAKLNPQMTYVYGEAAEITTIGGETQIIPSGVKHMSGSRSRTLLYDNGPFINSPGTGPNGTDQSILQNVTLGMNTLGAGIQFASGNRMADDIVVDQTWTVETITVYAYQTGSPTTSTMTGGYVQVWDGDPAAGGQVIWGDIVTNRMASTAWTNSYRLSEGTPGTTRPNMSIVMATPGLVLEPGTYWIDYTLAGSLASGPWAPPITVNGQAVTGNAKQFLGSSSTWQDFLDTGTGTPAQGLPFLIEGTAGGGGGGDYNLTGYNIYRDGALIATNATTPRTYLDAPLAPGTYTYGVSALYDQPSVGESDPVVATVTISSVVDINMQNGTITICEGNFYDSGGPTGQYQNSENLILTFLPSTAGAKMKFNFVEFNTEANYDYLKVFDGPNTSSPQIGPATGFNGVGVPALLAELVATNAQGAITFHFTSDGSVQRDGWKALISCFTPADVDLEAKSVSGNITPSVGTASTYNVEVKNLGSTTQSTYTVKLMQAGGVELNSVAGPTITAGQTLMVPISWTPTVQGPTSIYGVVEVAGDGNPQNNTSPSLNVNVQPEGIVAITVGVGNVLPTFRIPFDFYWKNSLSQTIYYPEELENIGGALLGVNYYNSFTTNLPGKAVKIWVGTTQMADLSQGWADPSGFTLVYDGTVDFPSGSNAIYIPFSEPYIYAGGNLVIYTNRVWEDVYFLSSDLFYATETASKPNRTRHVQLDATVFDPMNPPAPAAAQLKSWHPNTTLFFNTSGLGALQGVVSSSGQPVEGVKIQVEGTSVMTHTNAQGQYNFPYLLPGNINVTASKFGYVAQTLPTTIVVDQTTTLNFSLQAMPTVTVSGFVGGSDAPTVGLAGAQVSLEGYENYQATTNAAGAFSIPGVYASNTYAVEVSASGYADYSGTAVVGTTNLVLPNIILQEVMAPPANLTADIDPANPNLVHLAWNMQQDAEFRYDDGVRLAQLGSSSGTLNTVLGSKHTTSAVLSEMSWLLSDDATGGGPHNTIKIYVFGLTGAGIPNGSNVLYSATVSNTDGVWNTHTFPTPVTASGGFFLGVAYAGFVGLGTDDGVGDPYVFQTNTHYFVGDYTAGGWETWETYNFLVNGMIRGMGVPGGKVSYAVNETPAPQVNTANSGTLELIKLAQPVACGEPSWTTQGDQSRSLLGFNIYKNGEVMAAMVQEMTYSYTEMQMGVHCYHVTAMYGSGESAPSNQDCVDILVGINELVDANTSIYPNPAKSSLTIESLPMSRITVINALGQTVLDMEMNKQNSLVLSVEGWDAGVYMLRIVTSEGIVTKRATIVK